MNKELRHSKEGLPPSLLQLYQWIPTGRNVNGKMNVKAPANASWNQRKNWRTYAGVDDSAFPGFCLTRGYVCFDFDHVKGGDGKTITPAVDFMKRVAAVWGQTYIEESVSHSGRHAFYRVPDDTALDSLAGTKIDVPLSETSHVEVWIGGHVLKDGKKTADSNRQIALTGWRVNGSADDITAAPNVAFLLELKAESDARKERERQKKQAAPPVHAAKDLPKAADGDGAKNHAYIKRALDYIPCNATSYDEWLYIGMALKEEGFDVGTWDEWSKTDGDRYHAGECVSKWESFHDGGGITGATIYEIARRYGYQPKEPRPAALDSQQGAGGVFWPDMDAKGRPVILTEGNAQALLDSLGISLRNNEMTKSIEFYGDVFKGIPNDGDRVKNCITKIRGEAAKVGLKLQRQDLIDALELIAARHVYHPARNFLKKARADYGDSSADFIGQSFDCFILDDESAAHRDLCLSMYTRFLVAAARAPFNTLRKNESYQGILILVGPQHIGKTRFLEYLVPSPDMRCAGVKVNPNNRDDVWRSVSFWAVELGEFGTSMSAKRVEDMKNFVTASKDVFRKAYGRGLTKAARQTFFYGSTNQQRFLCDETGDRRYWPIVLKGFDFADFPPANLLWGQVMTLAFADGDSSHSSREPGRVAWWLSDTELDELTRMQEAHKVESEEETALKDLLDWNAPELYWQKRTATELATLIANTTHGGRMSAVRIGKTLKRMSMTDKRIKCQRTERARTYTVPPMKNIESSADTLDSNLVPFPANAHMA